MKRLVVGLILIGFLFRLALTEGGNFIFNIDNARDMVDVREMVVLHHLRLTGPNSAIAGVYDGPAWYYLLAIPFILSNGHPYGSVVMMIVLWAIGGYFLLKLSSRFGWLAVLTVGVIWATSNYMVLASVYAFNPHPVTFLMPLFIFLLEKYLKARQLLWSVFTFLLAGLFFNFEMNFGIFLPVVIILSIWLSGKKIYFKDRNFWLGTAVLFLTVLPQILFDMRHNFLMAKSLANFLTKSSGANLNIVFQIKQTGLDFFNVLVPTFLNSQFLSKSLILIGFLLILHYLFHNRFKNKIEDRAVLIAILIVAISFIGYVLLPVAVNPWHLGAVMTAVIFLTGFSLYKLISYNVTGKLFAIIFIAVVLFKGYGNIADFFRTDHSSNNDPSAFKNEVAAIDYVYKQANGKNFRLYAYLPSVIDYPYQYLVWWRGLQKYNYTPKDYAYAPNEPPYIKNKEALPTGKKPAKDSGLIFLIKEPDSRGDRHLWENHFTKFPLVSSKQLGPLLIETRQEIP